MEVDTMYESYTFEVTAKSGRKGTWNISLNARDLMLTAVDRDESFQILRVDAEEKIELRESSFTAPLLIVSIPKKKVVLKLEHKQAELLKKWLGPPTIRGLKVALRQRLRWCLPIGIFFVIASIPLPADPEAGIQAVPFDAVSAFLGSSLILLSILTRLWPRRILFLLDGVWFSLLALDVAVDIYQGDSPWWAILIFFLILGAKEGFRKYRHFASVSYR